jgi:hypothetical protein
VEGNCVAVKFEVNQCRNDDNRKYWETEALCKFTFAMLFEDNLMSLF